MGGELERQRMMMPITTGQAGKQLNKASELQRFSPRSDANNNTNRIATNMRACWLNARSLCQWGSLQPRRSGLLITLLLRQARRAARNLPVALFRCIAPLPAESLGLAPMARHLFTIRDHDARLTAVVRSRRALPQDLLPQDMLL